VSESHFNINNNLNNVVNQLNKIKVNEYIQREKEVLESKNKLRFVKKNFKQMQTNLNHLGENLEKYFTLPKKSKHDEIKLKLNEFCNGKNRINICEKICKEP
jgi:hypothetical protein